MWVIALCFNPKADILRRFEAGVEPAGDSASCPMAEFWMTFPNLSTTSHETSINVMRMALTSFIFLFFSFFLVGRLGKANNSNPIPLRKLHPARGHSKKPRQIGSGSQAEDRASFSLGKLPEHHAIVQSISRLTIVWPLHLNLMILQLDFVHPKND